MNTIKVSDEHLKSYTFYYNLIVKYINFTLKIKYQINEYVPNTHIANTFLNVLEHLELENKYWNEYQKATNYRRLCILPILENKEYFKKNKLTVEEIERVYDKLRAKEDYIRNEMKLINIQHSELIMRDKVDGKMNYHKVQKRIRKNE